jgi:hypothetical protein
VIKKRAKSYGVRVYIGGRQQWVGTFPTHREAKEAELEARTRRRPHAAETCGDFARRWINDYPPLGGVD